MPVVVSGDDPRRRRGCREADDGPVEFVGLGFGPPNQVPNTQVDIHIAVYLAEQPVSVFEVVLGVEPLAVVRDPSSQIAERR